jgi:hypothetical protein
VFAVLRELLIQILDDFHFVVVHQTRLDEVVEGGEALLDTRRNVCEDHRDAQADVSHDCTSHYPSLFCEWKLFGLLAGSGGIACDKSGNNREDCY